MELGRRRPEALLTLDKGLSRDFHMASDFPSALAIPPVAAGRQAWRVSEEGKRGGNESWLISTSEA